MVPGSPQTFYPVSGCRFRIAAVLLTAALLAPISGSSASLNLFDWGPTWEPKNVYINKAILPVAMRRVAVLPMALATSDPMLEAGRDNLNDVVFAELRATRRFEFLRVEPDSLRRWTGREFWKASDELPTDWMEILREQTGCDAVLLLELTHYRPYAPVAVGFHLTLVTARDRLVWWAVDELLDAGEPSVARSARKFYRKHVGGRRTGSDPRFMVKSPRLFARYAMHCLAATLPEP